MENKCKICKLVFECNYKNCCCPKCHSPKTSKFNLLQGIMNNDRFILA